MYSVGYKDERAGYGVYSAGYKDERAGYGVYSVGYKDERAGYGVYSAGCKDERPGYGAYSVGYGDGSVSYGFGRVESCLGARGLPMLRAFPPPEFSSNSKHLASTAKKSTGPQSISSGSRP